MSNIPNHNPNDLEWMAFCYVADELNTEQRAEFELRLASDQAACDAVVRAMRMCEVVSRGHDRDSDANVAALSYGKSESRSWSMRPNLLLAASVVLALFSVGWVWMAQPGIESVAEFDELAETWGHVTAASSEPGLEKLYDDDGDISDFDLFISESESTLVSELVYHSEVERMGDDIDGDEDWMLIALEDLGIEATN